jgi:uncharacterized protein YjbI with pentapeptide repeats
MDSKELEQVNLEQVNLELVNLELVNLELVNLELVSLGLDADKKLFIFKNPKFIKIFNLFHNNNS